MRTDRRYPSEGRVGMGTGVGQPAGCERKVGVAIACGHEHAYIPRIFFVATVSRVARVTRVIR
jgi:hypothetical protein